jgi:hypothetical protein
MFDWQAWAETADDCLTLVSGPGVAEFRIGTKVSFHFSVRTRQSSEYRIVEKKSSSWSDFFFESLQIVDAFDFQKTHRQVKTEFLFYV